MAASHSHQTNGLNQSHGKISVSSLNNNYNYSHTTNANQQYSTTNGRISNVSFASYEKIGPIDDAAHEHQLILENSTHFDATPMKAAAIGEMTLANSTIDQLNGSNLDKTLALLKSPKQSTSTRDNACTEANLSVLNGMFGGLGHTRQQPLAASSSKNGYSMGQHGIVNLLLDADVADNQRNGSERVNDIYVNRNVGALYGGPPVIGDGMNRTHQVAASKTILLCDDPFAGSGYKGFYLHGSRLANGNDLNGISGDAKIYNAFSRQTRHESSAVKMPSGVKVKPMTESAWDSSARQAVPLDDDELANILGYIKFSIK